jgi:hypothetical protein
VNRSLWMTAWCAALGLLLVASASNARGKPMEPGAGEALRTLNGEEVRRVLTGNTLVGYDSTGPFWMYYPSATALWGLASSGDVDIGTWRIKGNSYCRAWRLDGRERCWLFATDGSNRLLWITPDGTPAFESTVQPGNTIGQVLEARASRIDAGVDPAADPPAGDEVTDGFGNRLSAQIGHGTKLGRHGINGGIRGRGGDKGGGTNRAISSIETSGDDDQVKGNSETKDKTKAEDNDKDKDKNKDKDKDKNKDKDKKKG